MPDWNTSWPPRGVRPEALAATEAICKEAAKRVKDHATCSMAFSAGKDSVATMAVLHHYFKDVVPIYWYLVPGLGFIERSLKYYEEQFGFPILRLPHRKRWMIFLNEGAFQPPYRITALYQIFTSFPLDVSMDLLVAEVRASYGLDELGALHATGIRASDSPTRSTLYRKYGGFAPNGLMFYPIITWTVADVEALLTHTGLQLAPEYKYIGRSFDGLKRRYLECIREHWPEDYAIIKAEWPLIDVEFFRANMRGVTGGPSIAERIPLYKYQGKGKR